MVTVRPGYGPNYKTPADEARALRKDRSLSWFDAWAFALLLLCVLTPVFYLVTHTGAADPCRTTQTWCSVQSGVAS